VKTELAMKRGSERQRAHRICRYFSLSLLQILHRIAHALSSEAVISLLRLLYFSEEIEYRM